MNPLTIRTATKLSPSAKSGNCWESNEMTDALMTLQMVADTLPDPVEFRRRAMQAARDGYAAAVDGQDVRTPEDTASVQLSLARTRELAQQYAATFTAVDKELARFQRDQLELLPGGPSAFKVADSDGDIIVQLDTSNTYTFDEGQLLFEGGGQRRRHYRAAGHLEYLHLRRGPAAVRRWRTATATLSCSWTPRIPTPSTRASCCSKVADSDGDIIVQLDTSNTYTF